MPEGNVLPVLPSRAADLAAAPGKAAVTTGAEVPGESFGQVLQAQLAEAEEALNEREGRSVTPTQDAGSPSLGSAAPDIGSAQALAATLLGMPVIPQGQLPQEAARSQVDGVTPAVFQDPAATAARAKLSDRSRASDAVGDIPAEARLEPRAMRLNEPVAMADAAAESVDFLATLNGPSTAAPAASPVESAVPAGAAQPSTGQAGFADATQPFVVSAPADVRQDPRTGVADSGVGPALQSPRWGEAFSDRVLWIVQGKQPAAELQLNPPQLGPVEVRVSVTADQAALSFFSPHAAVREAIQAALPRLQEALAASGLTLEGFHVGAEAHRDHHFASQHADRHSGGHARPGRNDPGEIAVPASAVALGLSGVRSLGGVDLFA